jgi:hypothetical protein
MGLATKDALEKGGSEFLNGIRGIEAVLRTSTVAHPVKNLPKDR